MAPFSLVFCSLAEAGLGAALRGELRAAHRLPSTQTRHQEGPPTQAALATRELGCTSHKETTTTKRQSEKQHNEPFLFHTLVSYRGVPQARRSLRWRGRWSGWSDWSGWGRTSCSLSCATTSSATGRMPGQPCSSVSVTNASTASTGTSCFGVVGL